MIEGKSMSENPSESTNSRTELENIIQEAIAKQMNWVKNSAFSQIDAARTFLSSFQKLTQFAMFKTNVRSGGRISIPEAERQTVGLEEGMPVQVIIFPLEKK
jgi:hypothetical protein